MRMVLTGGGTGGHIYPALALWAYMAEHGHASEVLYIGTERGLERDIVARAGVPFHSVEAAGLKRQLSLKAVRTAWTTFRGYRQAIHALREFRPDVVVGTGGYVTLPVIYAAHRLGIPSVVWEANARPGLTNKLCEKKVYAVAVSFSGSERFFQRARNVVFTGHPRGSEVLAVTAEAVADAKKRYGLSPDCKLIVCYGGSRGAETVNQVIAQLVPRFRAKPHWQLIFATGDAHLQEVSSTIKECPDNVRVVPYIHDMPALLHSTDVVITRAGGSTLAEICSLGLSSILIPSPYVTANHQEENAKRLAEQGAASVILERDLTPDKLWRTLEELLDEGKGLSMRSAARSLATPNAVGALAELVISAAQLHIRK